MSERQYEVIWTGPAIRDLEAIGYFIAKDSPANAVDVVERIETRGNSLELFPLRGRSVPELELAGLSGFRELIVSPWRVIYRVEGDSVRVFAVLDGRRNVDDILLERLTRA